MPASPDIYTQNSSNYSVPVTAYSDAGTSIFWSILSTDNITNHPNPDDIPNGPNDAPEDSLSLKYDDVDLGQQDHHHPHISPAHQYGLPQVGVKSCVKKTGPASMFQLKTHPCLWR